MSFLSSAINSIRTFYGEINPATLTGAIDVIVVEQKDGSFHSSPFHVRFGKLGVLKSREKIVGIEINGEPVDIHMKLDDAGTAFFVEELKEDQCPDYLATSPIPESPQKISSPPLPPPSSHPPPSSLPPTPPSSLIPLPIQQEDHQEPSPEKRPKIKKKRKLRPSRHSRTGSKTSLREINTEIFEMDDADIEDEDSDSAYDLEELSFQDKEEHSSSTRNSIVSLNSPEIDNSFLGSRIPRSLSEQEQLEADLKNPKDGEGGRQTEKSSLRHKPSSSKGDVHYFSEPDETEKKISVSKAPKRPKSPCILSDSEFETSKKEDDANAATSWRWGELPSTANSSPSVTTPKETDKPIEKVPNIESKNDVKKWSIFNYLRANRREGVTSDGVYLDDINDEEMLALYVGSSRKYEDAESGNGPSLPVSPHPVETRGRDEGQELSLPTITLSLCGKNDNTLSPLLFEQSVISFDDFVLTLQTNSKIFEDPNLVVKVDGRYYSWKEAFPTIMSWILYKRPLPSDLMPKRLVQSDEEEEISDPPTILSEIEAKKDVETSHKEQEKPKVETSKEVSHALSSSSPSLTTTTTTTTVTTVATAPPQQESEEQARSKKSWWSWYSSDSSKVPSKSPEIVKTADKKIPTSSELEKRSANISGNSSDSSATSWSDKCNAIPSSHGVFIKGKEKFKKTLRLSSDDVKRLNLREGSNEAEFSITTPYQGTTRCKCHIYLWKYTDKLVISDIDGTITKSDVLGHIFPIIGRDWAQSGVAQLFSKIRRNGYHMVYLSARAIGQASLTKDYLQSIKQGDLCLPDGPLLLNPTSLISAFHREVIEKKPEEFKISCLRDIQRLFDEDKNPFYAGYGNRINDAYAYRIVGIPVSRIFTINYQGELKHELTQTFQTSYGNQSTIVDHLFPPRKDDFDSPTSRQDFSSFTYWREPIASYSLPASNI